VPPLPADLVGAPRQRRRTPRGTPDAPGHKHCDLRTRTAHLRWLAAAGVAVWCWYATRHDICQVATTIGSGSTLLYPRTQATTTCAPASWPDFAPYLLLIAVLLLPDAQSIGIGGLKFERLTSQIERQTGEISQLRQQISTVVSASNALSVIFNQAAGHFADLRDRFRSQKALIDKIRPLLPADPETLADLARVHEFAGRIDSEDFDPLEADEALRAAKRLIDLTVATGTAGDSKGQADEAPLIEDVLPRIVPPSG
jgi:hypothetical protein